MVDTIIPNTFGIKATTDRYLVVSQLQQLRDALATVRTSASPFLVVGAGSNMVFTNHFHGTILHLDNKGVSLVPPSDADTLYVEAAAGEVWDDFVRYCVSQGWHGAENLVAIPGTVGAAPVQNVGAYGIEAKDIIHSVRAIEVSTGQERIFSNEECRFGYRNSIFKGELVGQYVVWSVTFCLHKAFHPDLQYRAVVDELAALGISNPLPQQLIDVIADIRWRKLPRPEHTGSAGSFFKNPIVPASQYQQLKAIYPDMVVYPAPAGGYKLAAGWLIEHAGWKGRNLGRCGVYEHQALVLVNRGGCTGSEVVALADAITADVKAKYGVTLEKEAIII